MKFGKNIYSAQESCPSSWQENWVDYKCLKKLIKQICSEASEQTEKVGEKRARETSKENLGRSKTERAFFLMLLRELAKVNNHYVQQYKEIEARNRQYQDSGGQESADPKAKISVVVQFYEDLLQLENFAILNYIAFSKILKKHDKRTGFDTRRQYMRNVVNQRPFHQYTDLKGVLAATERMYTHLEKECGTGSPGLAKTNSHDALQALLSLRYAVPVALSGHAV
jgi:SPX domain protein involved in polyphosphate accumulation